jgi:DUF1365 family protein
VRSHLVEGTVRHRRARPFVYALEHDVWYAALDLAELDETMGRLRLVSRNRRNIVSLRDADHLLPAATDLDADVRAHLRSEGIDATGWQITLVANLRIFGYVFNPASFYLCRDLTGELQVVIIEVHNTHHERRLYTLRPERRGEEHRASMEKDFYVSPFIDMAARYTVRVWDRADSLRIAINEEQEGAPLLTTSVVLRRRLLSDRTVLRMLLRHPLVTHKTIAMIHVHALRLWRRGATFHRHGQPTPGAAGAAGTAGTMRSAMGAGPHGGVPIGASSIEAHPHGAPVR